MPFETLLKHVIKRRKPEREKSDGKGIDGKDAKEEDSSSSEEEEKETPQEWIMIRDPQGNVAWQNRRTGQVTYGQSYTGYDRKAAGAALDADSDSDEDDDKDKKKGKKPAAAAAMVAPVAMHYPPQYPPGVGYMPSPVAPVGYMASPVTYGMSPVAMYPAAPWNAMPVSPVPVEVPEYVKKQHAELMKAKKKKEEEEKKKKEEEKKRIAAGVWERHYTNDGGKFWQHSVTGKKVSEDPFR
eukprot:g8556.t1